MKNHLFIAASLLNLVLSQPLFAGEDHHHDHEKDHHSHDEHHHDHHAHDDHENEFIEHSSHVHGEAQANIVYSKEELTIHFILPALNVFGFEHAPKNETEEQQVKKRLQQLNQAASVLNLGEECQIESSNVVSDSDQEHYDVEVSYQYHCHNVAEIELSFLFFDQLHELEKITVQYLSDQTQNLYTLTPANSTIYLH